jgi:enhancing lycopene biosynthesis protein 2
MSLPTPKIGVILSGCGVFDGSEIHEAVITLLCLDLHGAAYQCLAPERPFQTVNHLTKQPAGSEKRSVLVEAARIARGDILDLAKVKGADYDGFVLPGGFGAAKNLCTFAVDGPQCQADPQVARVLTEAHAAGRPIGFICIAPAVAAKVFGQSLHPALTIGHDAGTAAGLEKLGARHQPCDVGDFILDAPNRILSTPAYMEARSIKDVYAGVNKLVEKLVELAGRPALAPAGKR